MSKIRVCMWVRLCAEGIFVTFPWWLKNVKSRSKIALFQMSAILKFDFQKRKQLLFFWSKLSKLHKKRLNFACDNYIFPKTRGNKNKQCTHFTPLKIRGPKNQMLGTIVPPPLMQLSVKDLRGNPKPWVAADWTETGPGSGNIFKNIFWSGRGNHFA